MPEGGPLVSVIVPAFNEEAWLPATLAAIQQAIREVPFNVELIVSDNDSTDGTAEVARRAGALVTHETHRQIAANRNAGARAASGRWLVFVDADTVLTASMLTAAVAQLEAGAAGGGALPEFDCQVRGAARLATRLWHWLARRIRWACGAFVFCRRDAFEAVGGFDTRYYCSEEIHLSRALRRWGRDRAAPFVVLEQPFTTSGRKLQWFSGWQIMRQCAGLLLPGGMRRRGACDFWYQRPPKL